MNDTLLIGLLGGAITGIISLIGSVIVVYRTTSTTRSEGSDARQDARIKLIFERYEADLERIQKERDNERTDRETAEAMVDKIREEKRLAEEKHHSNVTILQGQIDALRLAAGSSKESTA